MRKHWAAALALSWAISFSSTVEAGENPCRTELPNAASQFWIPLIGHGTDPFGNQFDTVFKVINLQETAAAFNILTCSDSGEVIELLAPPSGDGAPVSTMDVSIPGRGTATLRSLNSSPDSNLDVGWATIATSSAVGVEVIFNIRGDNGFLTSTNVRVGIISQSTTFFADIGPSVNTGVAFMYPPQRSSGQQTAPDRVEADLFLRDDSGDVVAQSSISLGKSEKQAMFLGQLLTPAGQTQGSPAGASSEFSGTVDVRLRRAGDPNALERWAILPLRQEGLVLTTQNLFPPRLFEASATLSPQDSTRDLPAGGNLCTTNLVNDNSRVLWVPQVGHGTDPFGNQFNTVFKVINLGSETANLRMIACSESGQMINLLRSESGDAVSLIDFTVPANGSTTLHSLNADPPNSIDTGWVAMTTPNFAGLEVVFNILAPGDFFTSTNVTVSPIVTAAAFFADIGPDVNTGVAFLYPVSEEGTPERVGIDVFLLDEGGTIVAQTSIGLDPGEKTAQFLSQFVTPSGQGWGDYLKGASQSFSGSVEIRASQPVSILPLRQEGLVLSTQNLFPPRSIREAF